MKRSIALLFGFSLLGAAPAVASTGSYNLTDASGLVYYLNDNITFSTTSSASGAASEASYSSAVQATTINGGLTSSTLNDSFDGYYTIRVDGTTYNMNGVATPECGNRQLVYAPQTIGDLTVSRKVYVPDNDVFARWMDSVTNNGSTTVTVPFTTYNNLGSDSNTRITRTSSGDLTADTSDNWVASMQNFSGSTSSDVRLAHIYQNNYGSVRASAITFVDGDDNPTWTFDLTIEPGQTVTILHFNTGHPSRDAAAAAAARLEDMGATSFQCMTQAEWDTVVNFGMDCSHLDDACNEGQLDVSLGCTAVPANEGASCDDGTSCTENDVCTAGTCEGTTVSEVIGDGIDQDCDGNELCYVDADNDGYLNNAPGTISSSNLSCSDPYQGDATTPAGDCNDAANTTYPGASEVCNSADDDCNGTVDDHAINAQTWFVDADSDTYGDPNMSASFCAPPMGYVGNSSDCNDQDAQINFAATEVCNGVDDNCNGAVDDNASDALTFYMDADADTHGSVSMSDSILSCDVPAGYVSSNDDCDDNNADVSPDAIETCNGVDDNCNGSIDDSAADAAIWYMDGDSDGFGYGEVQMSACSQPNGYVGNMDDCDDGSNTVYPGAAELCNQRDDNCNGTLDEDATDAPAWYADTDGDGAGDANAVIYECGQPPQTVTDSSDCDDQDPNNYPGNTEIPDDGLDQDCDGVDTTTTGDDTSPPDDSDAKDEDKDGEGCGCSSVPDQGTGLAMMGLGLLGLIRRRRS